MQLDPTPIIQLADNVIYIDENLEPYAAMVTHVFPDRGDGNGEGSPVCNLAIFGTRGAGGSTGRRLIKRVEFDTQLQRWRLINRYALKGEVPKEELAERQEKVSGGFAGAQL